MSKPKNELKAWAASGVTSMLRRCFLSLAAQLEREARAAHLMSDLEAAERFEREALELRAAMPKVPR